jgi:type IV secretion system protein VirB8
MSSTKTITPSEEKAFYAQGIDWEADRECMYRRSERRAWIIASISMCMSAVSIIGIAVLAPFRQIVPYVLAVDRSTGNVEVMDAAQDRLVGYQELQDKHWAQKYVTARESYMWTLLQYDYDTVLRLSDDPIGRDYAKLYEGSEARDKKYGSGIEMRVNIISVTLPPDETGKAVVRFEKTIKRQEADSVEPPQAFVATLAYSYQPSMFGKEKDLIENPLGFKVTSYRIDSEVAQPPALKSSTQPKTAPKPIPSIVPSVKVVS